MTVFQNKSLVKAYLEKNNKARKNGGKFRFRQKKLWHRNRYRNLILVSVADTKTKFWYSVRCRNFFCLYRNFPPFGLNFVLQKCFD